MSTHIPPVLDRLLADLKSPSPSIQKLEVDLAGDEFGGFFKSTTESRPGDQSDFRRGWVRLRVLGAIGNCTCLRSIHLNPHGKVGAYSVTEDEAQLLLEGLQQSNNVLEELYVSGWQGFGTAAACEALAGLLRSSRSLTTLRLAHVGLTGDGLGHIAAALRTGSCCKLKQLGVSGNRIGGGGDGAQHLADIVAHTATLQSLGMFDVGLDVAGGEMIANALLENRSLEELAVGWERDEHASKSANAAQSAALARILNALAPPVTEEGSSSGHSFRSASHTPNVKTLWLRVYGNRRDLIAPELGKALAQMLRSNTCVKKLVVTSSFVGHGLEALRDSTTITSLDILHTSSLLGQQVDLKMVTSSIMDCKQLERLRFSGDIPSKVKRQLFGCLKDNHSIKHLVIDKWQDLDDGMFKDLTKSLQVNTTLETISMKGTSWDREGKTALLNDLLQKKIRQAAYLNRLRHGDMVFNHPKVGRLFLCGSAYAGKTTLKASLIRSQLNSETPFYNRLFLAKPPRTQGIEIEMLRDDDTMQISIWDLAGQDEYRALQSFLFPRLNQACIFFFVFSRFDEQTRRLKVENDLERELEHWLRFIASNASHDNDVVPQVVVVLTHLDKMPKGTTRDVMVEWATQTVIKVRRLFDGLVDISEKILVVNSTSLSSIAVVRDAVYDLFRELFGKLKLVPQACTRVSAVLAEWRSQNPTWPIMRVSKFTQLCLESVTELQRLHRQDAKVVDILEAMIAYLHDVGVVIYFKKLKIVVVDPNWVSHVFLGKLMTNDGRPGATGSSTRLPSSSDGFVPQAALKAALSGFLNNKKHQGFDEKDMIDLMLEMKLCHKEQTPGALGVTRYFIPNTLIDVTGNALHGLRQLEWFFQEDGSTCRHITVGRRLQCKDRLRTYLDPGFFPRFQVILRDKLFAVRPEMKPGQHRNELNLIAFHTDGMEVLIEMPGDVGDFIDILVRSRKSAEQTRAFVVAHVLNEIRAFCASSDGSQGVELVEGIIRPECVNNLTLCVHRRDQAVLKSELIEHLLGEHVLNDGCGQLFRSSEHMDYHHTWSKADEAGLPAHSERADGLLDPEDMFQVLYKKARSVEQQLLIVEEAAKHVLCDAQRGDDPERTARVPRNRRDTTFGHTMSDLGSTHRTLPNFHRLHIDKQLAEIKRTLGGVDEKLDVIMSLQRQVLETLEAITLLQEQTLEAVSSSMDKIMSFSAELQSSEMPRRPYFTTDDVSGSQKLFAGLQLCKAVTLHFMCEDPNGNHMVGGQVGLPLMVARGKWDWIRPIALQSAKMLVFLVKAGLHVTTGIGSAVPDFAEWTGAVPLTAATSAGERLLEGINLQSSESSLAEQDKCLKEAWVLLKEELKPRVMAGQMGKLFQLYKVRFSGGHQRGVTWVCKECMVRGRQKGIVYPL